MSPHRGPLGASMPSEGSIMNADTVPERAIEISHAEEWQQPTRACKGKSPIVQEDAVQPALSNIIEQDLMAMADYWVARKHEYLWLANSLFMGFVDPAFVYGEEPIIEQDSFNMMFTEWVLFEFPFYDGRTPLEEYLAHPPLGSKDAHLERLQQLTGSQFFSRFEIRGKEATSGACTLVDVCTGKRYDVLDRELCDTDRWRDGTIATRIARVRGTWLAIGRSHFYDRAAPHLTTTDGPGFFHPEDRIFKPWAEHAGFYLRLMRDIIGIDGRYRRTTKTFLSDPVAAHNG